MQTFTHRAALAVAVILALAALPPPAGAQELNQPKAVLTEETLAQDAVVVTQAEGTNGVAQMVKVPWADFVGLMGGGGGGGDLTDVNYGAATASTLVSDAFTRSSTVHIIEHEGAGPADTLATIAGGAEGDLVLITRAVDANITVSNGVGNIDLGVQGDGLLNEDGEWMALRYDGAEWELLWASPNTLTVAKSGSQTFTILEPDLAQPISDAILLKHFPAEQYPNGVTITSIHLAASANNTDSFDFEEWNEPDSATATPAAIETVAFASDAKAEDNGIDFPTVAADAYLFVDLPATPTDLAFVAFTITWSVN